MKRQTGRVNAKIIQKLHYIHTLLFSIAV